MTPYRLQHAVKIDLRAQRAHNGTPNVRRARLCQVGRYTARQCRVTNAIYDTSSVQHRAVLGKGEEYGADKDADHADAHGPDTTKVVGLSVSNGKVTVVSTGKRAAYKYRGDPETANRAKREGGKYELLG